jgi:hypothetical protein
MREDKWGHSGKKKRRLRDARIAAFLKLHKNIASARFWLSLMRQRTLKRNPKVLAFKKNI